MNKLISLLKPDMVSAREMLPWLEKIDENRWYTNFGPLSGEFERALSRELGVDVRHLTSTASGTAALQLSLETLGLPDKGLVLIPALTFPATAVAVIRAGLRPVIADVDLQTWLLTSETAQRALAKFAIKAVVPVSTFGIPQSAAGWDRFTEQTGIPVIIDAAGAFGNQDTGSSTTVVFSLHSTKTLSSGEGGVVVCADEKRIEEIRNRSNFGIDRSQSGRVTNPGLNAKLSEYHAAVGLANLARWRENRQKRRELLITYRNKIKALELPAQFQRGQEGSILSIFNVRFTAQNDVAALQTYLSKKGIETRRWYHPLIPVHPEFSKLPCVESLTDSMLLSAQLLGLPFHLDLTAGDIDLICESLELYHRGVVY